MNRQCTFAYPPKRIQNNIPCWPQTRSQYGNCKHWWVCQCSEKNCELLTDFCSVLWGNQWATKQAGYSLVLFWECYIILISVTKCERVCMYVCLSVYWSNTRFTHWHWGSKKCSMGPDLWSVFLLLAINSGTKFNSWNLGHFVMLPTKLLTQDNSYWGKQIHLLKNVSLDDQRLFRELTSACLGQRETIRGPPQHPKRTKDYF